MPRGGKPYKFTKKKAKVHPLNKLDDDVTVWVPSPPFKMRGQWYVKITTTTSGYYRDFLYKQVGER